MPSHGDVQPVTVPGPHGTCYEAHWGRKTTRSKTYIGRVHLLEPGGGAEAFACSHRHLDKGSAQKCAHGEALLLAARAIGLAEGQELSLDHLQVLRDAVDVMFPNMPVEFRDPS